MISIWNYMRSAYNEMNTATLTGAIDVVVIQQEDGTYQSSPFHVRFGKIGVLRSREKVVDIEINGEPINIHMKLGESGEAFFVEETDNSFEVPPYLATSPINSYPDMGEEIQKLKQRIESGDPDTDSSSDMPSIVRSVDTEVIRSSDTVHHPSSAGFVVGDEADDDATAEASLDDLLTAAHLDPADHDDIKSGLADLLRRSADGAEPSEQDVALMSKLSQSVVSCTATVTDSTQFKPIRPSPSDDGHAGQTVVATPCPVVATVPSYGVVTQTEPVDVPTTGNATDDVDKCKSKKKRKRKSVVRRKMQQSRSNQMIGQAVGSGFQEGGGVPVVVGGGGGGGAKDNSTSSEEPSEEIFQMDADLDECASTTSGVTIGGGAMDLHVSRSQADLMTASGTSDYQECTITSTDEWQYQKLPMPRSFHPYSDGEASAGGSPSNSRPSTPKSDTEYEIHKMEEASQSESDEHRWSWTWGELPVPPKMPSETQREEPASDDDSSVKAKQIKKDQEERRSTLGGVFKMISMPKKDRQVSAESEGRYLDDLNVTDMEPEVAQLYFSRNSTWTGHLQTKETHSKDEDSESGNGSSLPQSPHSVEGAIGGGPSGVDSDLDERSGDSQGKSLDGIAFSLCGNLENLGSSVPDEKFEQALVTYENFCNTPTMINNPNLVIRFNGKYYNWQTAAPIIMSVMVFHRPLPETVVINLVKDHMPEKPKKAEGTRYSWFKWGRSPNPAPETADGKKSDNDSLMPNQLLQSPSKTANSLDIRADGSPKPNLSDSSIAHKGDKRDSLNRSSDLDSSQVFADSETSNLTSPSTEKYKKSLRLTSEKIAKLNLHKGPNEVVFSVTTAYQGTTRCKCHIYLWNYDDQIIISDIDGTITKSDVLGHILPIVGTSWAQSGVAQLFTNIKRNGYQFLYLSARAIGQARVTRDYLRSIRQGDLSLPDGPLLLSPSSLLSALRREVIEKKPEEFKISCLRDIQALFVNKNPFYAGYGNKVNDVWAYRAVGIPMSRIFTINHRGELKHELNRTFQSSYASMSYVVDHVFPPLVRNHNKNGKLTTDFVGAEEFSSFTYWREPLPDIELELEANAQQEKILEKK